MQGPGRHSYQPLWSLLSCLVHGFWDTFCVPVRLRALRPQSLNGGLKPVARLGPWPWVLHPCVARKLPLMGVTPHSQDPPVSTSLPIFSYTFPALRGTSIISLKILGNV